MKIIALAVLIMISATTIFADQTNKWEGIYTFHEESWDENRVRESRWFRLEVAKKDAKTLTATYSDGLNSTTINKFLLTVVAYKENAVFSFEKDLTQIPCSEGIWLKGEKFLELKEGNDKDGKIVIKTIWGKKDYSAYSEKNGGSANKILFRKS
jgi:hypothetical protein